MKSNYKITKVAVAERVKFFSLKQNDETINVFANGLRQSANYCNFPVQFYQQALITAFVMGVTSPNIKESL